MGGSIPGIKIQMEYETDGIMLLFLVRLSVTVVQNERYTHIHFTPP